GLENIQGKACYVLELPAEITDHPNEVTSKKTSYRYYEVASGLLLESKEHSEFKHATSEAATIVTEKTTSYSDYRTVDGVLFSFQQKALTTTNGAKGLEETVDIESLKTNLPVDESLFTLEGKETFDVKQTQEELTEAGNNYTDGVKKLMDKSSCDEGLQL